MINMGIDFGSTYTMVSVMEKGEPTVVQSSMNSYHYPSIACYDREKKKYFFGNAARNKLGQPDVIAYRGFKMLLAQETDRKLLKMHGYIGENTPESITERFLDHVISESLKKLNEDKIGLLVVGAPECWFQSLQMVDARGTLRKICQNICKNRDINHFELRSEPTDAAAFCVWKYEKKTGRDFNGKLMVIDYGGGTLDTTLVGVEHIADKIQIKPEILGGVGENHDNEIGKAGIAYQEAVVRRAISDASNVSEDSIAIDKDFHKAVKQFEDALLAENEYVEEIFQEYNGVSDSSLKAENFTQVEYNGGYVKIDFAQMKTTYDKVIAPSLEKVLKESTAEMAPNEHPFLTLVGGFCNFYLVRNQIRNFFNLGSINKDIKMLSFTEGDREKAIAYGAGLLANKVLEVCRVAGFGIGMCAFYDGEEGKYFKRYAINYGQEYIPNKIYFAKDDNDNIAGMVLTQADKFLLNFSRKHEDGIPVTPKKEIAQRLKSATQNVLFAVVGFSIDEAERITIHIFKYDTGASEDAYGTKIKCKKEIPLETFKESFNNILYIPGGDNG